MVAGPSLASPILPSPAAILKTLKNLAGKIGKRNAQVYNQAGYSSGGSFQPSSSFGNGFSDGTDFGSTFVDFGVSSGGSSDTGSCTTTYEEQCSTVNEQVCDTVNEQQCR